MTDADGMSSVEYHLSLAIETLKYHRAYMGVLAEQMETLVGEWRDDGAIPVGEISELAASIRTALAAPSKPPPRSSRT